MRTREFLQSGGQAFVLLILGASLLNISIAQVRSSDSYTIQSDSINVGGGFSSSTNFNQESTVGEIATGESDSSTYALRAGYQQMQEVFISLMVSGEVVMSPDLAGITGGTSNGSTSALVVTDSPSGYQLLIEAENEPAMQRTGGGGVIADYDAGVDADYSFVIGPSNAQLGFSPEGVDVVARYQNNGVDTCGVGSFSTARVCWDGLSTSTQVMATGAGANHPSGATTTVHFRVGIGSSAGVIAGVYIATTTITALPL